jgi:hypothetical protein
MPAQPENLIATVTTKIWTTHSVRNECFLKDPARGAL